MIIRTLLGYNALLAPWIYGGAIIIWQLIRIIQEIRSDLQSAVSSVLL